MVKICGDIIDEPLALIINKSFEEQLVSELWKRAKNTPVHNKGAKSDKKTLQTCVDIKGVVQNP